MSQIMKKLMSTANAAMPSSACSQAVVANRTVYASGIVGVDKNTDQLVLGGVAEQTDMALKNLAVVLESAGSGLDNVVKNYIYVKDYSEYPKIIEVYKKYFTKDFPARTGFQVARLPMDALVEIESIAVVNN